MKILYNSNVDMKSALLFGDIAQLGERFAGSEEVRGSRPLISI